MEPPSSMSSMIERTFGDCEVVADLTSGANGISASVPAMSPSLVGPGFYTQLPVDRTIDPPRRPEPVATIHKTVINTGRIVVESRVVARGAPQLDLERELALVVEERDLEPRRREIARVMRAGA